MGESNLQINEYIYFDDQEISSILAQVNRGYPSVLKTSVSDTQGTERRNDINPKISLKGESKIPFIGKGGTQAGIAGTHSHSTTNSNINQSAVDSEYEDYALNVIEENLREIICEDICNENIQEGNLVKFSSDFNFFDIKQLKDLYNSKSFMQVSLSNKQNKKEKDAVRNDINNFKNIINALSISYEDTMLLEAKDSVIIAKESKIRMSHSQITMLDFTKRKLTVLGRVESIIDKEENELKNIINNVDKINKMMPALSISMLSELFELKKGNKLIKPIALYFT
ncbi:DUF6414 family protein [Apilactobacillus xinyiensis]|uniref:DUF6414 family protein n=1 Tax=Apilactobacillus xinyiensis TaxID=2841032 RepID=UPI00200E9C2E|nr:hypothetical protein [Apilactobacillus xinyiensis]MCL0330676.1 hypothetical protein [Apilactobacillus xinyiensis]